MPFTRYHYILTVWLALLLVGCQKKSEEKTTPPLNPSVPSENNIVKLENDRLRALVIQQTIEIWLGGYVTDEQGQPLSAATVGCGGKSATTDSKGFFYFPVTLTVNKEYALISVKKTGYMNGFRTFTPNPNALTYHTETIKLQQAKISAAVPVAGGSVVVDSIKIDFQAGELISSNGNEYAGNVKVKARYINPASVNYPELVPGLLTGIDSAGKFYGLVSLGMANVELSDEAGNPLQVAGGKTVHVEMPASPDGPPTIPLWHFNESYGIWVQQGVATKQGKVYAAAVSHFSIWNLDGTFPSSEYSLQLHFQTVSGTPLPNLKIKLRVGNFTFDNFIITDSRGDATLVRCPGGQGMTLKIMLPCDTVTRQLAVVFPSRSEVVTLDDPDFKSYEFSGTLYRCDNERLSDQPFQLLLHGSSNDVFQVLNGVTDADGNFHTATVIRETCQAGGIRAETMCYVDNQFRYSQPVNVVSGINNYSPSLCYSIPTGNQPFNDSDVVVIPDPNFRKCLVSAAYLKSGTLYYADVKDRGYVLIDRFRAQADTVRSIMGLQYFTALKSFIMTSSLVTDITPLQNLTQLEELSIQISQVEDISPLQKLTRLRTLQLGGNRIADISALKDLVNLQTLDLSSSNGIADISPLRNCTKLQSLQFNTGHVSDISVVAGMPDLEDLQFVNNQVTDIIPVKNLKKLTTFSASFNQLTDILPLQDLDSLKTVGLNNNRISNLVPLQNKIKISTLNLKSNLISDITPLQSVRNVISLYLNDNQITSLQPFLDALPKIFIFGINGNPLAQDELLHFMQTHTSCTIE